MASAGAPIAGVDKQSLTGPSLTTLFVRNLPYTSTSEKLEGIYFNFSLFVVFK